MNTTAQSKRLKVFEIALLAGLAIFFLTGGLAVRTQDQLADKVVRLHVLANSDSPEDQALKLLVRDRVLGRAEVLLASSTSRAEAEGLLRGNLLEFEREAREELEANGCDDPVSVELTDMDFPTREYDGFTLPAGRYLALRVLIGQAQGHNWWCVVFPPLCTAASTGVPASALAAGFSEDEVKLITEENRGYELRLKSVEWWESLRAKFDTFS